MYKLYQSRETIWWDNVIIENVPDWDNDDYFYFQPVESNGINFETYRTGLINVKDKTSTYFKLEKENGETTYWFVKKINKVLKDGYQLAVELDVWYTYTRHILRHMKLKDDYALIDRVHFTTRGFYKDINNATQYIQWMTKKDPIIDDIEPSYSLMYYELKNLASSLSAMGGGVSKGTLTYGSSSNHLFPLGLYLVFVAKPESQRKQVYDLFPIMTPEGELVRIGGSSIIYQNIVDITTKLIARVTRYGLDGFLGLYKGPVILPKNNTYEVTESIDNQRFIYFSIDPIDDYECTIPFDLSFPDNKNMVEQMVRLQTDVYFGATKKKLKNYFKSFDFANKRGRDKMLVRFANGFIGLPKEWSYATTVEDMEGFGNQLPSPAGDYNKTITQAKTNFDTSLANQVASFGTNVVTSGVSALINPALGSFALGGSVGGLVTGAIGSYLTYKNTVAGASATFINSFTTDIFYFDMFRYINKSYNLSFGTNLTAISYGIRYTFTDDHKQFLTNIYDRIGYPVYQMINMRKFFQDNTFTRRYYIKFNQEWINVNIRKWLRASNYVDVDSDVIGLVANQLSNGVLCWKTQNIQNGVVD